MSIKMKKKLYLIGICLAALILIFAGNVYKQLKTEHKIDTKEDLVRNGEVMKNEEAVRLLSYLGVKEEDLTKEGDAQEVLTFGRARDYLDKITEELDLKKGEITDRLAYPLLTEDKEKEMLTSEFLSLYDAIREGFGKDLSPVSEKSMYILGSKDSGKGTLIITDQGEYTLKDLKSYEEYYQEGGKKEEALTLTVKAEDYIDCRITALVKGKELVCIREVSEEETVLANLWIVQGKENSITAYAFGITREFKTEYPLSKEIGNTICDLTLKNKQVVKITMKPDTISGKVLSAGKDTIEIQGYGKVPLEEGYRIYKIYDELSAEVTNSILVGSSSADFVVADGKIAAALIKEPIKAENIRVLIKTNNFNGIFHEKVVLTADKDFTVTAGKTVKAHKAGDKVTINPSNKLFGEGRLRIETKGEGGKITLLSVTRSGENPKYRGAMEVAKENDGLTIVNELSMEEYLYAVVPSEMPTSYNMEALKAQAVCARSYAYNQLMAGALSEYGAQVDDSVNYQVYNNQPENEQSILAVKDTYGKVLKYQGAVVDAYYFSTSWGYTASLNEVWYGGLSPYLVGKAQAVYEVVDQKAVYASSFYPESIDYSDETAFRSFLDKPDYDTYDSQFPWYRWSVTMSKEELSEAINKNLYSRYTANPSFILTLTGGSLEKNPVFESREIKTIGELTDIKIAVREKSGIISTLYLIGTKATVSVQTEYNIRSLLAPVSAEIKRKDSSTVSSLKLLPSAYICFNKGEKNITIKGGGYGHGVGMSQNGAKAMADSGKTYDIILKHYYTGTELGFIY